MKKHINRVFATLLCVILLCTTIPVAFATDDVPEGYTPIADAWDLYFMRNALNGNFILTADIDLTGYLVSGGDLDNNGRGWAPIGEYYYYPFSGTFDGNGHTIKGLRIEDTQTGYAGLFGYLTGTVKDLILEDVSVSGTCLYMGSVAAYGDNCLISGVRVSGEIHNTRTGENMPYIGGIVGFMVDGTIDGCANTASVSGSKEKMNA